MHVSVLSIRSHDVDVWVLVARQDEEPSDEDQAKCS